MLYSFKVSNIYRFQHYTFVQTGSDSYFLLFHIIHQTLKQSQVHLVDTWVGLDYQVDSS